MLARALTSRHTLCCRACCDVRLANFAKIKMCPLLMTVGGPVLLSSVGLSSETTEIFTVTVQLEPDTTRRPTWNCALPTETRHGGNAPPILQAFELLLEALIRRPSHARQHRREHSSSVMPLHMPWRRLATLPARCNARWAASSLCDAYRSRRTLCRVKFETGAEPRKPRRGGGVGPTVQNLRDRKVGSRKPSA
jgi:hypothetical protein